MDDDDRELANGLFGVMTAMLEDAAEAAAPGQSPHAAPAVLAAKARQIQVAAQNVATLAEAVLVLVQTVPGNR